MHELYPVDEIVERELGIPRASFVLGSPIPRTLHAEALDAAGRVVEAHQPGRRAGFEKFPAGRRSRSRPAGFRPVDGQSVADLRIETDPSGRDHYQAAGRASTIT